MRRRMRDHPHAARRAERGVLRAIDAGDAAVGEQPAPRRVREDHQLGDDAVERRAAAALRDLDALDAVDVGHAKRVVGPLVPFGPQPGRDARLLAARVQRAREAPQHRQLRLARPVAGAVLEVVLGDHVVERVVAQVVRDRHALDPRRRRDDAERLVDVVVDDVDVQRQRGADAAGIERERRDDRVGQHRDLLARRVDGGHPLARDRVDRVVACGREARSRDVDADPPRRHGRHRAASPTARRRSRSWPSRRC